MLKLKLYMLGVFGIGVSRGAQKPFRQSSELSLDNILVRGRLFLVSFAILLALFITGSICPQFTDSAQAESANINATINPVISIRLSTGHVALSATPSATGEFTHDDIGVFVSTNNESGYELEFSVSSDETSLIHEEMNQAETHIRSLEDPVNVTKDSQSQFTMNSWGYTVNNKLNNASGTDTTFLPIPEYGAPDIINKTSSAANNSATNVTFAARVNSELKSGSYFNKVVFTAIANYAPSIHDFYHIRYMQEMDFAACDSVPTPSIIATVPDSTGDHIDNPHYIPETKLVDIRDNAIYTVRKLADGNCWMTDNLRLGGSEPHILSSDDSDLPAGVSFNLSRAQTVEDPIIQWASADTDSSNINKVHVYHDSATYGNYYNWYTATAGTGTYSTGSGQNATGSVCPKGWTLPSNSGSRSFQNLINTVYGYGNGVNGDGIAALMATPFTMMPSGSYNYLSGPQDNLIFGYWWSKTAQAANATYIMKYGRFSRELNTVAVTNKASGYAIRCVAK